VRDGDRPFEAEDVRVNDLVGARVREHRAEIGVRLPDAAVRDELLAIDGAGPYGPPERPMGGYVAMPEAWKSEPDRLREWIGVALDQVRRMPPKAPRSTAAK